MTYASGLPGVQTARGRDDNDFLAATQAFRTCFGVTERATRDQNPVKPGFQLGRDGEVVHGCADDQHVRIEKLLQGGFVACHFLLLGGVTDFYRRARCGEAGGREMPKRIAGQIAVGDLAVGVRSQVGLDNLMGQLTRSRVIAEDAGVEVQ